MTTTHWILTATGRDFPLSGLPTVMPDAAPRIEDIAHALAQINRYTGHAARPYSVAEHSMLVCDIVRAKGLNAHAQLLALLHDAHEAYCGDVASPTKTVLGAAWLQFENALAHHRHARRRGFAPAKHRPAQPLSHRNDLAPPP